LTADGKTSGRREAILAARRGALARKVSVMRMKAIFTAEFEAEDGRKRRPFLGTSIGPPRGRRGDRHSSLFDERHRHQPGRVKMLDNAPPRSQGRRPCVGCAVAVDTSGSACPGGTAVASRGRVNGMVSTTCIWAGYRLRTMKSTSSHACASLLRTVSAFSR
jgi:hypothetical protein